MGIPEYLKKKQDKKLSQNLDLNQFVIDSVSKKVDNIWEELKPKIILDVQNEIDKTRKAGDKILGMQKDVKNGKIGATGLKGEKGDKGDSVVGPQGIKGNRGEIGLTGLIGKSKDGKDGKDGINGSPDKPLEIASKLNTLDGKVEIKVIKGLNEKIRVLQRSIQSKKSGGGSGNWITEAPSGSINDSNTTFTLTDTPATQGKALILLYQGQVMEFGNQFTISGKTITTLFTPETGTFLFALYMRA